MANVKASLQRKLGPLPVWAWALIAGAALYVYRTRRAIGSASNAANLDATSPSAQDNTGSGSQLDPVTLEPGQSAYDPNTGQLVSAPGTPGNGGSNGDGSAADPGNTSGDPDIWTDPNKGTKKLKPPHGSSRKTLTERVKRKPKNKPHHSTHGKPTAKPPSGKGKPRTMGRILKNSSRVKSGHGAPKARVRGAANSAPSGASRARAASAPKVAIRQRPAAPQVTHPGTQRVSPHPALAQTHTAAPAAHPQPARKPATRRRK